MTNLTFIGKTLAGNTIIQHKGINVYACAKTGKIIGFEESWFDFSKKPLPFETGEYFIKIATNWQLEQEKKEEQIELKQKERRKRKEIFLDLSKVSHRISLYGNTALQGRFIGMNVGVNLRGDFPRYNGYSPLPKTEGSYYRNCGETTHEQSGTVVVSKLLQYSKGATNYQTVGAKTTDIIKGFKYILKSLKSKK